jgi:glucose/arabinose dehydrogenase
VSFAYLRTFLLSILIVLLVACSGGGETGTAPAVSMTASLSLVVEGLPAGVGASVVVSGPNQYVQSFQGSQTIAGLLPGVYTVTADRVLGGATTYGPQSASQMVTVTGQTTAVAAVTYTPQQALTLALETVTSGLNSPLFLTSPPGDARLFIVERPGRIRIVQNGILLPTPFLDISDRTQTEGERGLLSVAFHPQYAANGFFFIFYTALNGDITIERFTVSASDPNLAEPLSGIRILSVPHPEANHNGGLLSFGPDGLLYIGIGDGGGSGDPAGNAQNTNSLLGKLLRVNVDASTAVQPYVIPASNPFVNQAGKMSEIWAYGLRNPWRYAFDTVDKFLYIGDVGEGQREEVDIASIDQAGLNYGWNIMEGTFCGQGDSCAAGGLTLPVLDYGHGDSDSSGCSIIGGYVYRGSAIPELRGRYLFSDLCAGWLRSFVYSNGVAGEQTKWDIENVAPIYSFGQDDRKELYILSGNGNVYRIVRK